MNFPSVIFLVGMPGSGKSTAGKYLARELGYQYIDLDHKIEESARMQIKEIFSKHGEDYFRKLEQTELHKISGENLVVSTGGGVPCFFDNMDWMNSEGFTVFLDRSIETLLARTLGKGHRPLLNQDPEESMRKLMAWRLPFYQKAELTIDKLEKEEVWLAFKNHFS